MQLAQVERGRISDFLLICLKNVFECMSEYAHLIMDVAPKLVHLTRGALGSVCCSLIVGNLRTNQQGKQDSEQPEHCSKCAVWSWKGQSRPRFEKTDSLRRLCPSWGANRCAAPPYS